MTTPTTVVNVRGKRPEDFANDPDFIYVGRTVWRTPWTASPFGNPFKPGMSLDDAIDILAMIPASDVIGDPEAEVDDLTDASLVNLYRIYVLGRRSLSGRLHELRGKRLGCWCCSFDGTGEPSKPCHAVVLARLADGLEVTADA